ncbi:MAG TPA: lasso peptide biosynthesis protein [Bacilli bacterium]|nr:lasso peptide biosynthesis protein [Bacilli bacterium]
MPTTQSLNFNESTNQELIKNVENILDSYYFTKEYTRGEFDCSDMAKQVMNILEQHNISSFLVYKVDSDTLEAHAWVGILENNTSIIMIDPTYGGINNVGIIMHKEKSPFYFHAVDIMTFEEYAYRTGDFLESQKLYEKI